MSEESRRFKVTIDAGRVFYVYAQSSGAAIEVFKTGYPEPTSRLDVEEDVGEWKTTLQDGRTVIGG